MKLNKSKFKYLQGIIPFLANSKFERSQHSQLSNHTKLNNHSQHSQPSIQHSQQIDSLPPPRSIVTPSQCRSRRKLSL